MSCNFKKGNTNMKDISKGAKLKAKRKGKKGVFTSIIFFNKKFFKKMKHALLFLRIS